MHPREATGTPKSPSPIFGSGSVVFVEWSVGVASKMENTPSVRIQKISAAAREPSALIWCGYILIP